MQIKQGKYVHISIKDSGSGIPENLKSKVINPFFTTKKKGSGLGLAISYSIIHKHKGSIHFTSKENEGTTFHIYLKASTKSINSEEVLKEEKIELEGRILLMDDEKEIRKTGIRMLSRLGFKPVAVRNGEEALAEYKKSIDENNPFKAVILDITIQGGMGGKQTIIELLKINPDIKAIVSSGYSEQKVINEYLKYGFKGFLKKAYTLTDLRNILIKIISD
jgi:CheY-like chemotaxis protein